MTTKTTAKPKPPYPAGLFFHLLGEDGLVNYQGRVVTVEGTTAWCYLAEWFTGSQSNGIHPLSVETYDRWRFYETAEEMQDEYEHRYGPLAEREREHKRREREQERLAQAKAEELEF